MSLSTEISVSFMKVLISTLKCAFLLEENRSRSRHNVKGFFVGVLYFGRPNQPSSGTIFLLELGDVNPKQEISTYSKPLFKVWLI